MTCTPLFVPSLSTPEPISSTELPISIPLVMKKGTTESTSTYSVPLKSIEHHASCHETTRRTSSIEKCASGNTRPGACVGSSMQGSTHRPAWCTWIRSTTTRSRWRRGRQTRGARWGGIPTGGTSRAWMQSATVLESEGTKPVSDRNVLSLRRGAQRVVGASSGCEQSVRARVPTRIPSAHAAVRTPVRLTADARCKRECQETIQALF